MPIPLKDILDRWHKEQIAAIDAGALFMRELVMKDGYVCEETDVEFRARVKLALYGKGKKK